jgi:hypothetical protein
MEDRKSRSWKFYFVVVLIFLITGVGIAVSIGLSLVGIGWAWPTAAILLGVVIFLLISRTRVAGSLLPFLSMVFPIIGKLQDESQKRFKYRAVVDKMEYTLEFYRLCHRMDEDACIQTPLGHCSFTPPFREELINTLLEEQDPNRIIKRCAERVVIEIDPPISSEVLALLYQDRHGPSTLMFFRDFKLDNDLLLELADILDQSKRLPGHENLIQEDPSLDKEALLEKGYLPNAQQAFPYEITDIAYILSGFDAFSLRQIRAEMFKLRKVWEITSGYLAFLMMNRALPENYQVDVSDVLLSMSADIDLPGAQELTTLTAQDYQMLSVLLKAGESGLAQKFGKGKLTPELQCLNLVSLGMFFTEKRRDFQNLKAAVCRLASENETAVLQHLAYLEYREDLREERFLAGLPFVSVEYISDEWVQTVQAKREELESGFDKEVDAIRENLAEGNWWTRLPSVIDDVLEKIRTDLQQGIQGIEDLVKNRPPVGRVLRRIFRGLKLETIERFLEARTITAYLLTFDGLSGSMATLVDCLSFFKGGKYREGLTEKGVQFTYEHNKHQNEKYIFKEYIKQCRLGIVPMGMDFETFCQEFEKDLIIAFTHRDELQLPNVDVKGFEIIIQRFGLSGRDRYGFDELNQDAQRKHALPRIQELFSISLFSKDIIALIGYEQSTQNGSVDIKPIIDGILSLGTIHDFLEEGVVQITRDQKIALNENDTAVKQKLLQKMEFESLRGLAYFLVQDAENLRSAIDILTQEIGMVSEFSGFPQRCSRISQNYIETLADIAEIYQ